MGFVTAADDEEGWVQTTEANDVRIYRGTVRIENRDNPTPQHNDLMDSMIMAASSPVVPDDNWFDGLSSASAAFAPQAVTVANLNELSQMDPPPVAGQIAFLTDNQEVLMRVPWDGWIHIRGPVSRTTQRERSREHCLRCHVWFYHGDEHHCPPPPKTAWERLNEDDF